MNKRKLMISVITIVGVICILVGSIAYYRITVNGSIKGSTGNAVFNVTGFTNESTKEITLKEGNLVPGDKGLFTLSLDATNSDVDMYVTLSIDKGTLPTNLKFYTSSDYKAELHKYYEFMDTSNQSKDITIYWYWNPYLDDAEDSNFINKIDVTATIKLDAVQISEYAMMKNGSAVTSSNRSEFWKDEYRPYIRMINFINDLSNLPETCNEENLCFDVSYSSTQNKKVYAYLIDSGLDSEDYDENDNLIPLYNLYIASEAPIFAPTDCSLFFAGFNNLISINYNNNFNTSYVTDMSYMYTPIYSDDGNWSGAVNLAYSQKEVKPSFMENKNDGKLELMISQGGISYRSCIENLDLSSFNTSNVTNMSEMFYKCSSLTSLDLSNFNTSNVTTMQQMFTSCSSLTSLDLSSFNTSNVTDMLYMFGSCRSLTSLDISSFNTSSVTTMQQMFDGCSSLTSLDISSFNTSNVTNMLGMFKYCSSLTSLDLSSFNTSKVTNMGDMFGGCRSLTSLDISSFNTSNVTDMAYMFDNCSSLISLDISSFNTSNVTSMLGMFASCQLLTSLDLSSFNTSNVTDMGYMFVNCPSLTNLDLSIFNTSKVTDMGYMFNACSSLTTTINIMSTGITSYSSMFTGAATSNGAKITVNYIADASALVDNMIATKSASSNVVKGSQI